LDVRFQPRGVSLYDGSALIWIGGLPPQVAPPPAGNPHTSLGVVAAVVSPKADALLWQNDALVVGLVAAAFDSPARDGSDLPLWEVGGWRKVGM